MENNRQLARKLTKKEARKLVYDRLTLALAEFRAGIKDKRFQNKLERASKLFATDIAKATRKLSSKANKKEKAAPERVMMQPAVI